MKPLLFLFVCTAFFSSLHAQSITLHGLVTDKQSGEYLPGATIVITGKKTVQVQSGLNGFFSISKLEAGAYPIKVFYVGYLTYNDTLVIDHENSKPLHLKLAPKTNELTEISISGKMDAGTESSAQLAARRADVLQNVISARAIDLSPDLSVANVTQRVSGVSLERSTNGEGQYAIVRGMDKRYIYTLVNGIKIPSPDNKNRYVPLDIFPAELLDRLEVTKSLMPNMEGDAIGGAINMVMKDAPEQFSIKANAALGFADKFFTQDYSRFNIPGATRSPRMANGAGYQASIADFGNAPFTYSTRHDPFASAAGVSAGGRLLNNKLGVMAATSFQNNYRNVNSVFFGTETDRNNGDATVTGIQSRQYSIQQQRSGLHTRLDYRFNKNNRVSAYAGYMNLMKNEFRFVSDTNLQLGRTGPGTGRISNEYRTLHDVQQMANATVKGEHALTSNLLLNWTAAWSKATGNRPDEATLNLTTGVSKDTVTKTLVQSPLYLDARSYRTFTHSTDEDRSGYLNLSWATKIAGILTTWQAGGMFRNKTRNSQYDRYELRPVNPAIQQYDGDINHNTFEVFNGKGTYDDALNYSAKENVGAAYAMVKMDMHKLQLKGGARFENTDLHWESNVSNEVDGKTGSISYYDVLPSALIKYSLGTKQVLQASYYAAISRPNFYEIIPHKGGDPEADYTESGNPYLKRTTADNFDLRYEFYPQGVDQVLAGVFYKKLNNPIEYALEDTGTFTYYIPDNFGKAANYGFELDITKYLRWFGIRANYTFTDSRITTSKIRRFSTATGQSNETVSQTRPLQGQSKHIVNVSLLIKDDKRFGINAQLAFNYTGRRINTVSQFLNNDIWQKGFAQLDFSLEKKLFRRWFVYTRINNLLNTPYQLEIRQPYTGGGVNGDVEDQQIGKNVFVRKDTYGASYLLGVKFRM